jgi:hydrogenase maturation protease
MEEHSEMARQRAAANSVGNGVIVIGLGSPNGDDQIGWLLANEIARRCGPAITVRTLSSPVDLAYAVEGFSRAVIIDAVRCQHPLNRSCRWQWPSPEIALVRASGTHAIGLVDALQLADELNRLPVDTVIWGIPAQSFSAGSEPSSTLQDAVPYLAEEIIERDLVLGPAER